MIHIFFQKKIRWTISTQTSAPKENSRRAWSPGSIGSTYVDVVSIVVMKKRWDIHGYQWNIGHFFCHWNENLMINWNDHLTILDENYIPIINSSTGIGIMPAWDCFNLWPVSWENRLRNHYQSWGYLWSQLVGMVDHGIHIPPVIWRMENHQLNS